MKYSSKESFLVSSQKNPQVLIIFAKHAKKKELRIKRKNGGKILSPPFHRFNSVDHFSFSLTFPSKKKQSVKKRKSIFIKAKLNRFGEHNFVFVQKKMSLSSGKIGIVAFLKIETPNEVFGKKLIFKNKQSFVLKLLFSKLESLSFHEIQNFNEWKANEGTGPHCCFES